MISILDREEQNYLPIGADSAILAPAFHSSSLSLMRAFLCPHSVEPERIINSFWGKSGDLMLLVRATKVVQKTILVRLFPVI